MINETGTFFLEGEYQQGDTILSAGDWELRADIRKTQPDFSFVRRNLLNWSEDFGNSYWVKNALGAAQIPVITPNAGLSPKGSLTASRVDFELLDASNSSNRSRLLRAIAGIDDSGSVSYTTTFYVKAYSVGDIGKTLRLTLESFPLAAKTITLTAEYQRVDLTLDNPTVTNLTWILEARGNVTSQAVSILLWGAQLELGTEPSAYQKTTTQVYVPLITKDVFAYTPDTFVRRNLLNWSEDSAQWSTNFGEVSFTHNVADPEGGNRATRITAVSGVRRAVIPMGGSFGAAGVNYVTTIWVRVVTGTGFSLFFANGLSAIDANNSDWHKYEIVRSRTGTDSSTVFQIRPNTIGDVVEVWQPQVELGSTPTPYQRTTTVVPRPYAIKDELVTNGTFDTDLSGWLQTSTGWVWDNGTARPNGGFLYQSVAPVGTLVSVTLRIADPGTQGTLRISLSNGGATKEYSAGSLMSGETYTFTGVITLNEAVYLNGHNSWNGAIDSISIKEVEYPVTLGNANHKDFRYYPKALPENEQEALKA